MSVIVLDSTPLGLITQPSSATEPIECRNWLAAKMAQRLQIVIPEIVDYELRRELLRLGKTSSIARLDQIISHPEVTFLPISRDAMKNAAELWANVRKQGKPLAHPHALDIDVILAAQVLTAGYATGQFVVATANVGHLSLLVPADLWRHI